MRRRGPFAVCVVVLALCGCRDKPAAHSPGPPPATAPVKIIDAAPVSADAAAAASPTLLRGKAGPFLITRASVDRLSGQTPATKKGLAAALAPLRVTAGVRSVEGEEYPVFEVHKGSELLFHVVPNDAGRVVGVVIESKRLRSPEGIGIGTTWIALVKHSGPLECGEGEEDLSLFLLCTSEAVPNMTFLFEAPEEGEQFYKRSPAQQRAFVGNKPMVRLHWSPPEAP